MHHHTLLSKSIFKRSVFKHHLKEDRLKAQLSFHVTHSFPQNYKSGNNAALSLEATCGDGNITYFRFCTNLPLSFIYIALSSFLSFLHKNCKFFATCSQSRVHQNEANMGQADVGQSLVLDKSVLCFQQIAAIQTDANTEVIWVKNHDKIVYFLAMCTI